MQRTSLTLQALILFASLLLPGCRAEETIEQYEVTHLDREMLALRVAIVPHEKNVYFFHLSGPEARVKEHAPILESLVKTVRFEAKKEKAPDDDEPAILWTEPKEWVKDPPLGERIASYRIETQPKAMEMKVTAFPREKFSLIANVHRWQRKMNIPLSEDHDVGNVAKKANYGDQEVTWVVLVGRGVHELTKAQPVAQRKAKLPPPPPPPPKGKVKMNRGAIPFEYPLPDGWEQKEATDGVTRALFEVTGKGKTAKITFTNLAGGDLASNIHRWRLQVGLKKVSDEEAVAGVKKIKIAGLDSHRVDVANPNAQAKVNRIVVALVPLGGETWFIRISGDYDWVGQNLGAFDDFLKSLRLRN